jgi:hypothetical protein
MMVVSKPASTAIPANAWDCPQGIIGDHAISKLAISAAVVGAVVIATRFVWSIPQLIFRAGSFPTQAPVDEHRNLRVDRQGVPPGLKRMPNESNLKSVPAFRKCHCATITIGRSDIRRVSRSADKFGASTVYAGRLIACLSDACGAGF